MNSSKTGSGDSDHNLRQIPPKQSGKMGAIQGVLESGFFQRAIMILIIINAITLGLETSDTVMKLIGPQLLFFDNVVLTVFVTELVAKLIVYRSRFHKDPWNIFDLIVVTIAMLPATGSLSVLRSLRVLRVLRVVSAVPSMRRVVGALLEAIPGISSIIGLLFLVFYVFSVMATKLFGVEFSEWFGTISASAYSLFQIMTLEGWSESIARPVMEVFPLAWAFFVPFILITSFTVLNLFIGIVVDAMQSQHNKEETDAQQAIAKESRTERAEILVELRKLRDDVAKLGQQR
ncbi:MAG: ion transporter [Lysobacterales bacterium]